MQQRLEGFLFAMLDDHCERNADRVSILIVITARCSIAIDDLRTNKHIGKVSSIHFVECTIGDSKKFVQPKHPIEIVAEIECIGRNAIFFERASVSVEQFQF